MTNIYESVIGTHRIMDDEDAAIKLPFSLYRFLQELGQDVSQGYEQCAAKGCENGGRIILTVQYLKKVGYFCEPCSADLLRLGHVMQECGQ